MLAMRSPFSIFLSVGRALVLREAVTRLSTERAGWLWVILEPMEHVVFLMIVHGVLQHHVISGADTPLFIGLGVLGFFLMRNIALRGMDAVSANAALFSYRQVRAVDTIIARAVLEALLTAIVGVLLLAGCALFGIEMAPANLLASFAALGILWLTGIGLAFLLSVAAVLIPELAQLSKMALTPLYFFSAVMFPVDWLPRPMRDILLWNPLVHCLESIRIGFFPAYHSDDRIQLLYPFLVALGVCAGGLVLQVRYRRQLAAR